MTFWDSSAVVPLLIREPNTAEVRDVFRLDRDLVVWWATPVECLSAVARGERQGTITPDTATKARRALTSMRERWIEIEPTESVRSQAANIVLRHELRAADAFQLASALEWAGGVPTEHRLCVLDRRLAEAARREGFDLVLS